MSLGADGLRGQRFKVRFLGRPWAWIWLGATGAPFAAAWFVIGVPARGDFGDQRSWFIWTGNVLLVLFVATLLFSARKWSIRLPYFRDYGRGPRGADDRAFTAVQDLNTRIRGGAFASDDEILSAAKGILDRCELSKAKRVNLRTVAVGGRDVRVVELVKREPFGRLEPWLEMHMGVGAVACLAVWLHADFVLRHPVGWLLMSLSMIVLLSGVLGALFFRVLPPLLAKADPGIPYEEAGVARQTYARVLEGMLATLDDELREVLSPLRASAANPGALADRNARVIRRAMDVRPDAAELIRDLAVIAGSRDALRWTTATSRRLDFWMKLWRWVHVPCSLALFGVIAVHVLQVLWY